MENYRPRIADEILEDKLDAMGCVLIEGPKYCGKTTLACQHAKSVLYMADPDTRTQNLIMAETNISRLLQGETPRLIDEWQIAPQFWDAVRNEIDKRNADGQFILTGSAVPPDTRNIFHSGAGRMSWLRSLADRYRSTRLPHMPRRLAEGHAQQAPEIRAHTG